MLKCYTFAYDEKRRFKNIHRILSVDKAIKTKINVIIQNLIIILGSDNPESS